ncbi:MAG: 50S ribosomal protein L15 [Acidobacteria bacterium]|nr:MAG: 50S ribosomal protein L15 [Acidobacteriota bacterium]
MGLHNLKPAEGAVKKKRRLGIGPGSGRGKTAGRGHKGQKSRSGYAMKIGFEGGQMPLQRRLPKRGFTNPGKKQWAEVNLDVLERRFQKGETVTPEILLERRIIRKIGDGVVILGRGELTKPLTVTAHRFSASAKEKIEAAGGTVQWVNS